jgi:hypothetical protein
MDYRIRIDQGDYLQERGPYDWGRASKRHGPLWNASRSLGLSG